MNETGSADAKICARGLRETKQNIKSVDLRNDLIHKIHQTVVTDAAAKNAGSPGWKLRGKLVVLERMFDLLVNHPGSNHLLNVLGFPSPPAGSANCSFCWRAVADGQG